MVVGDVFHTPKLSGPGRQKNLDAWANRYPARLRTREETQSWLDQQFFPASKRWLYCGNGKSGTSSTKRFLFELEFGRPLSAHLLVPFDINPDVVSHRLAEFDVFRSLADAEDSQEVFASALRLTTVRNPYSRAVSAFLYLCKSDDMARHWFAWDRVRMNAMVGFDWDKDPRTATGFEKFLDYIASDIQNRGLQEVNPHWRPQHGNIRPGLFDAHMIGKTEDLGTFFKDIAARLDQPLPATFTAKAANQNADSTPKDALLTPAVRQRIARIYGPDFAQFDYDPDAAKAA